MPFQSYQQPIPKGHQTTQPTTTLTSLSVDNRFRRNVTRLIKMLRSRRINHIPPLSTAPEYAFNNYLRHNQINRRILNNTSMSRKTKSHQGIRKLVALRNANRVTMPNSVRNRRVTRHLARNNRVNENASHPNKLRGFYNNKRFSRSISRSTRWYSQNLRRHNHRKSRQRHSVTKGQDSQRRHLH